LIYSSYEEIFINLSDEPDWYLKKNPVGEVPLLEWIDRDSKQTRLVPESLIVSDYLDNLYPENRLHPSDPYLKAKQQVLVGRFGNVRKNFQEFNKIFP
jgi:glutathione S-transferase